MTLQTDDQLDVDAAIASDDAFLKLSTNCIQIVTLTHESEFIRSQTNITLQKLVASLAHPQLQHSEQVFEILIAIFEIFSKLPFGIQLLSDIGVKQLGPEMWKINRRRLEIVAGRGREREQRMRR